MKCIILSIFIIFTLSILFGGCLGEDYSSIVGKWYQIDSDIIMVFQDNGILNLMSNESIKIVNYELIEDNEIKIFLDDLVEFWEYEFLDDNTMHLRIKGNTKWEILERVQ